MFGSFLPSLWSLRNHSLLGSRSRHCYAIKAMGYESPIELWLPNLTTVLLAGFGTDRLRREEVMKTADRENPNHGVAGPHNRAHGAVGQNRSCSIKWAAKQEKFRPKEMCFFLTSPFIELTRTWRSRTGYGLTGTLRLSGG